MCMAVYTKKWQKKKKKKLKEDQCEKVFNRSNSKS